MYLKHLFAETKIVNGLGEAEQWFSLLPPEKYQAAEGAGRHRFRVHQQADFAADEPVSLDLDVKNVEHADREGVRDQHAELLPREPPRGRHRHQPGRAGRQRREDVHVRRAAAAARAAALRVSRN